MMKLFGILFIFLILQRLVELSIAKKNEKWMKKHGAIEFGREHYGLMVAMHVAFLSSLLLEVHFFKQSLHPLWSYSLVMFIGLQGIRIWVIRTLGKYWNTKILVIPNARIVKKGLYKWIKHPNYLIVTLELLTIPFIFQAYLTLVLFFVLNQIILSIRIPLEEQVLKQWTNYDAEFEKQARFIPLRSRK
ncbi:15-methylpalmitoyl-4-hydroxy-2-pyrone 4-O-methyltransferase [Bacillus oleivorans]|uniref:15-methylpalmitoyl-4-hydroxy-2-pyrone 4-O-methyltransferase n=1 Tax=Bacillus oleivorans TaxID=1448271 RepID=A0A285CMC3_9BACI|nr:isoprenylcysteine carboxylmethyltransferase family protein [Bacillus oleivorans]SNX68208.1 15-methylpalmitoyl-4-hydroxy-2-pyrone 4-O-methyltransferase [Bacillus oleivorans]